jgi:hypothetical protein
MEEGGGLDGGKKTWRLRLRMKNAGGRLKQEFK